MEVHRKEALAAEAKLNKLEEEKGNLASSYAKERLKSEQR